MREVPPKTRTVPGAEIDGVISEMRDDVASTADASIEVTWRIVSPPKQGKE